MNKKKRYYTFKKNLHKIKENEDFFLHPGKRDATAKALLQTARIEGGIN